MKPRQVSKQRNSLSRTLFSVAGALLFVGTPSFSQAPGQVASPAETNPQAAVSGHQSVGGAEILSDTQGVDFNPYLKGVLHTIYDQWISLLPAEARPPQKLAGETMIRFTINPNGEIAAMHLDANTHSDALNKAAWGAITETHTFPQLPEAFHGPNLELRIRFQVNQDSQRKL